MFAESVDRIKKERAMRKRQLKWLWKRLRELAAMEVPREEMLMKLGAARGRAPTHCGVRWNAVTWAASSATSGIIW